MIPLAVATSFEQNTKNTAEPTCV